ncbi:MAG: 23S rRNA (adenine(2503)-C(2))-methyltransferase RlmN [Candidatus Omnitrophica bacterium]|nr:23S rRNA (adenine(2503)-C(2))-methyltransferase RlmN [Candidatus Omnitrophota bacterium]
MQDIKDLNFEELILFLKEEGLPSFRASQIYSWIYKKGILDFTKMRNIPDRLKDILKERFFISNGRLIDRRISQDQTNKILLELGDGSLIEAAAIPASKRLTACLSTQVGCKFSCIFCSSGAAGFKRNLTSAEILEQLLHLNIIYKPKSITHIVFMGIGEPLDNYDNVFKAIRIINSKEAFSIGARRITISTCGIVPAVKRMSDEKLQVELSVSLHAADDRLRSELMPVNKKYPLGELLEACKEYINKTGRQITFEYALLKGINSSLQNAKELSKILKGLGPCKVNIILANPGPRVMTGIITKEEAEAFRRVLLKNGTHSTIRQSRGIDIEAACGQLKLRYENK